MYPSSQSEDQIIRVDRRVPRGEQEENGKCSDFRVFTNDQIEELSEKPRTDWGLSIGGVPSTVATIVMETASDLKTATGNHRPQSKLIKFRERA